MTYEPVAGPHRLRRRPRGATGSRFATPRRHERKVAIVLANYPNQDGRIANGVGYDTPASTIAILRALAGAGYRDRANFPPRQ